MIEQNLQWMGLELKNPFLLASLTLFSKVNLEEHVRFLENIFNNGASGIVLPSVNPSKKNLTKDDVVVEVKPIPSGVGHSGYMGFTVFGPPKTNIVSVEYGIELLKKIKSRHKDEKVIASIANMGSEKEFIDTLKLIEENGADGIELNFSCPNVLTMNESANVTNLTIDILKSIRTNIDIPISLKTSPNYDHTELLNSITNEIDSLTLSNAFLGLLPPKLDLSHVSPLERTEVWTPTGIYGPQELMITYYNLYRYGKIARDKGIHISCVGGICTKEQAIQAILLGADTVQFSSAVAWKGVSIFRDSINCLERFMTENCLSKVQDIKSRALSNIISGADDIIEFTEKKIRTIDEEKCLKCISCECVERLCVAFTQKDRKVSINPQLCSGCGWCSVLCKGHAIKIV